MRPVFHRVLLAMTRPLFLLPVRPGKFSLVLRQIIGDLVIISLLIDPDMAGRLEMGGRIQGSRGNGDVLLSPWIPEQT